MSAAVAELKSGSFQLEQSAGLESIRLPCVKVESHIRLNPPHASGSSEDTKTTRTNTFTTQTTHNLCLRQFEWGPYVPLQTPLRTVFSAPCEITIVLLGLCTIGGLKGTRYAAAGFTKQSAQANASDGFAHTAKFIQPAESNVAIDVGLQAARCWQSDFLNTHICGNV